MNRASVVLAGVLIGACIASSPARAEARRTVASYDAAKYAVGSPAGGYGWAAWAVQSTGSNARKFVTYHDGHRRSFVPAGGTLSRGPIIVRADGATGTPKIYLVAQLCSGGPTNRRCHNAAYSISTGRRLRPSWLAAIYGDAQIPGSGAQAFDRGRSIRVTGVTAPTAASGPYEPANHTCQATVGGLTSDDRTGLPPISACSDPSAVSMRGTIAIFTANRPSSFSDNNEVTDLYATDTDRPTAEWVRIGSLDVTDQRGSASLDVNGAIGSTITDNGPVVINTSLSATSTKTTILTPTVLTRWNLGTTQGAAASTPLPTPSGFASIASPGASLIAETTNATGTGTHRHGTTLIQQLPIPN